MFLWFLIGIPVGFLFIRYHEKILDITGNIAWVENNIGTGTSHTVLQLVGILIVFFSIFYPLGACDMILEGIVSVFPRG